MASSFTVYAPDLVFVDIFKNSLSVRRLTGFEIIGRKDNAENPGRGNKEEPDSGCERDWESVSFH